MIGKGTGRRDAKEYNVLQVTLGWIPFWHDSVQVDLSIDTHITPHIHTLYIHTLYTHYT